MIQLPTPVRKLKVEVFVRNSNPDFVMDQFHPSSRKSKLNKHRKAPNEPSLSQSVEKKIGLWNPFVPESETIEFGFGGSDFDPGKFVFGESSNNDANGKSNNNSFDANANVNSMSRDLSLESNEGSVFLKILDEMGKMNMKDNNGNENENFEKLPDDMRKMDLKSSDVDNVIKSKEGESSLKPVRAAFAKPFVDIDDSIYSKLPDELRKMNLKNSSKADGSEKIGNENSSAGVFVFGGGVKSGADFSLSADSDESFLSKLHDEMRKIDMTDDVDVFENKRQPENSFVSGSSTDGLNSESTCFSSGIIGSIPVPNSTGMKSDSANFVFGSGLKKNMTSSCPNNSDMNSIPPPPIFSFTSKPPIVDFMTPSTKETLYSGTHQNKTFSVKKCEAKSTKTKKKNDKSKQSLPIYQNFPMQFALERTDAWGNMDVDSNGPFSPMDCSPYSRETSVASEDTDHKLSSCNESEEMLVSEAQRLNISVDSSSVDEQEENMGLNNESSANMDRFLFSSARVPSSSPLPNLISHTTNSLFDSVGGNNILSFQNIDENKRGETQEFETRKQEESSSLNNDTAAAHALCEKWRSRGNKAYSNGDLGKAEDYYTHGINSLSSKEIPSSCIRPLTLCYSNRAATRISLGKFREALYDSNMALSVDPTFLKARVRTANCLLAVGEIGEALEHFTECLNSEDISSHQKMLTEASDGLEKAQKVADLTGQSAELLLKRTINDASKALDMIREALLISPYSESLMEMKAHALLVMRNYNEVIKLCEGTTDFSEKNSDSPLKSISSPAKLWRSQMMAKSYFYLGKLEEALDILEKHEDSIAAGDKALESSHSFVDTIQELLRLKSAGNEAFQASRLSEAVEYYTSALTCNAESRPFTAVCFCNRAAAFQALGQISDAIADCSLAIALDSSYLKAISRKATLHEMIRDYSQATKDLNRLISFLQNQIKETDIESKGAVKSSSVLTEIKRIQSRVVIIEEEDRKKIPLDLYMILGIEQSSSAADIKKAYRKAALRHHPDKAGQSLARNENGDDGMWREVVAEVYADADRLFKMIGEAYTTLSDPSKRQQYDEEVKTCPAKGNTVSSPRYSSDKSFRHRW